MIIYFDTLNVNIVKLCYAFFYLLFQEVMSLSTMTSLSTVYRTSHSHRGYGCLMSDEEGRNVVNTHHLERRFSLFSNTNTVTQTTLVTNTF